jgi:hypothetical protein
MKKYGFFLFFAWIGFAAQLAGASYTAKYSSIYPVYISGPSNQIQPELDWDQMSKKNGFSVSYRDVTSSFVFLCPGDSVLIGVNTTYGINDRQFNFSCAFLASPAGVPIQISGWTDPSAWVTARASSLSIYALYSSHYDNQLQKTGASTCDATSQVLSGALSRYMDIIQNPSHADNYNTPDRQWQGLCTSLKDPSTGTALSVQASSCKDQVQPANASFNFSCPVNQVMTKISSSYVGADRQYQFTCCNVGI